MRFCASRAKSLTANGNHQTKLNNMSSLNKVILIGNLTRDLEMRDLPSGNKVGNFGLAVNRRYRTQDGDEREETTFVDIAAFGRSAENIARYCHKGSPLLVEGRLRFESWQNDQGEKRNRLSIWFFVTLSAKFQVIIHRFMKLTLQTLNRV